MENEITANPLTLRIWLKDIIVGETSIGSVDMGRAFWARYIEVASSSSADGFTIARGRRVIYIGDAISD